MVIAAGSVISEPSSGTAARPSQAVASGVRSGNTPGDEVDGAHHGLQDRPGGGHDHHDEDEQRLGVVARFGICQAPGRRR